MRQRFVTGLLVVLALSLAGCGGFADVANSFTVYEEVTFEDGELQVTIEENATVAGMSPDWIALSGPDERAYEWEYTGETTYTVDESDLGQPFVAGEYEVVAHASDDGRSGNHTRGFQLSEREDGDGLMVDTFL